MSSSTVGVVAVVGAVALAPLLADHLVRWIAVPSVVLEILLGILIGPVVLGWATETELIGTVADFGLAFLMFLAGYEIEFARIRGEPLRLAAITWVISLAVGLTAGALIDGRTSVALVVGLALTTTALGTILPMLHDSGALPTPFGARVMAVGALGEFGPIVAVALLLTSDQPGRTAVLLLIFAAIAVLAGVAGVRRRSHPRIARLLSATLTTSSQFAIRIAMLMVVTLVWVAGSFGLDTLLGAFAAGIVGRLAIETGDPGEREIIKSKLEAIGYGFVVPFFFVVSGIRLDLNALIDNPWAVLLVPLFVALFLVVRGVPVLWLFRGDLASGDRRALALLASTALPLVVVITTIGVESHGLKPSTAAALVCAGMVSVLVLPLLAFKIRAKGDAVLTDPRVPAP